MVHAEQPLMSCVFLLSAAGCPVKGGGEDGQEALSEAADTVPGQMDLFLGNGNPLSAPALDLSGPGYRR